MAYEFDRCVSRLSWGLLVALLLGVGGVGLLMHSEVDNRLTASDLAALAPLIQGVEQEPSGQASLLSDLTRIRSIVDAVFARTQGGKDIPHGHPREPAEVMLARSTLCYDRSRLIEKALRAAGFKTRHVSMYTVRPGQSALRTLMTPNANSHAITEVHTQQGWLLIDPSDHWLALDATGQPLDARKLAQLARAAQRPALPAQQVLPAFYERPFYVIYGLYSRHGQFYPPYNAIPDVSYAELMANWQP